MRSNVTNQKNTVSDRLSTKKAIRYATLLSFSTMSIASLSALETSISYASAATVTATQHIPLISTAIQAKTTTKTSFASSWQHKLVGLYQKFVHNTASAILHTLTPIGNAIFNFGAKVSKIGSSIDSASSKIGSILSNLVGQATSLVGTSLSAVGTTLTTAGDFIGVTLTGSWNPPTEITPSTEVLAHAAGKVPVVLIHGAFSNSTSMQEYYDALEKDGIPAYAFTIGSAPSILHTLFPMMAEETTIDTSAKEVSDYVNKVEAETKSHKVDLVGYSEGGLITRDYITKYAKNNVLASVSIGGIDHGTTADGLTSILYALPKGIQNGLTGLIGKIIGPSGPQILAGSSFQQNLSTYPETKAGIHYLDIASKDDLVATPYQTTFLKPVPGADVTNIEVHSIPGATDNFDHLTYPSDSAVIKTVTQYIETKGEPAKFHLFGAKSSTSTTPVTPTVQLLQ